MFLPYILARLRDTTLPTRALSRNIPTTQSYTSHPSRPRVAIVTGASQGIGRGIALRLARDGYDVALNDLPSNRSQLDKVSSEIESKMGRQALVCTGDVSVADDVKSLVARSAETLGGVDVMVANAGVAIVSSIIDHDTEAWDNTIRINLRGAFLCYKYAAEQMIKQGSGGRIIGACSIAGKKGECTPCGASYSASKFGIRALTQSAAQEWGKYGITVNAYAPGFIHSDMFDVVTQNGDPNAWNRVGDVELKPAVGFYGSPDDVSGLVSYLASDEARYITGQAITIDGGQHFD